MTVNPLLQDGFDVIDELAQIENDYVSMESVVLELDSLSNRISIEGISQTDVSTINIYDPGILPQRYPINSFTRHPSKTNLRPALEGLMAKAQKLVWTILEAIADFITKVSDWLMGLLKRDVSAKSTEKKFEDWKKAVDNRLAAVEKKLKEIDRDKDLSVEDKVAARRAVESAIAKVSSPESESRRRSMEAYTIGVRACMQQPDKMIAMLDYYTTFPPLLEHIKLIVKAVESTLNVYENNPTDEALMAVLGTTNDLTARFNAKLSEICLKLNRCKLEGMSFGYYDPERPDEYLANVRLALMTGCSTPSGKFFREDFKYGVIEAKKRAIAFSRVGDKVEDYLSKNDSMYDDLLALSKRLKVVIKRVRNLSTDLSTQQIDMRNKLLDISRLLRRSLFSYMRLRELPMIVLMALTRFATLEHYTEEEIQKAIDSQ